jgi:3-methyladenine DNA glycosylase AlkC
MDKIDCGSRFAPKRKGYVRLRDIPAELIALLNRGETETATLTEQTAMDFSVLLGTLEGWSGNAAGLAQEATSRFFSGHGLVKRMELAGRMLGRYGAFDDMRALQQLMAHSSDTVRGFACFVIAWHPALEFADKFMTMKALAADRHFGVREWAWLALRPAVVAAPFEAIARLRDWVSEPDANLRRFAVEITRPRGVWAKHIAPLQAEPWQGLPLLEPCCRDESRYVQDSVANWLNDAARSQPDWVRKVCRDWLRNYTDNSASCYIVKRAQRNLMGEKNGPMNNCSPSS